MAGTGVGKQTNTEITFNVSAFPSLNLLGRTAIHELDTDILALMKGAKYNTCNDKVHAIQKDDSPNHTFPKACQQLCPEFWDIFKPEMGCLKGL